LSSLTGSQRARSVHRPADPTAGRPGRLGSRPQRGTLQPRAEPPTAEGYFDPNKQRDSNQALDSPQENCSSYLPGRPKKTRTLPTRPNQVCRSEGIALATTQIDLSSEKPDIRPLTRPPDWNLGKRRNSPRHGRRLPVWELRCDKIDSKITTMIFKLPENSEWEEYLEKQFFAGWPNCCGDPTHSFHPIRLCRFPQGSPHS